MAQGPQTSLWTNSKGWVLWNVEELKGSLCIFPIKKCLQRCWTCLLLREIQGSKEGKADTRTLSLGWPSLWYQSYHLFLEARNAVTEDEAAPVRLTKDHKDAITLTDVDGWDGWVVWKGYIIHFHSNPCKRPTPKVNLEWETD